MRLVNNFYPNKFLSLLPITAKQWIWNMGTEGDAAALIKRVIARPESLRGRLRGQGHTAEHCDVATLETEARARAMTD